MKGPAKEESETELLQLLDTLAENGALFYSQKGEAIRERLKILISEQRSAFGLDAKRRLVLLFKLMQSCSNLLSKPPGFEWVLEEFIDALHRSQLSTKYGLRAHSYEGIHHSIDMNVFRDAWQTAWGQLHRGTGKRSVMQDYAAVRSVANLMVGKGLSLPQAVEELAHQQSPRRRKGRGRKDVDVTVEKSTIYAALRRVGNRERSRIQPDEAYLPGVGLIKPKMTDLRSEKEKAAIKEILAKRGHGFPSSQGTPKRK